MLPDIRKAVGMKTNDEVKARRYEQQLQDSPRVGAAQYFELGGMHRKTGDTQAAITAFLNAARLAVDGDDLTIAMAANKAIVQLEPGHKDALANLAYIRFQYGTDVVNQEYEDLLQELEARRDRVQYAHCAEGSEKNLSSHLLQSDDDDPAFDIERQACADGIDDRDTETENLPLEASWQIDKLAESSPSCRASDPGANDLLTFSQNRRRGEKTPTALKPKTRLWGQDRKPDGEPSPSQRAMQAFEANRKSLVNLIEGAHDAEYSASFELERQALVDLIDQSLDSADDVTRESDAALYFQTPSSSELAATDTSDSESMVEPDEIIDLRSEAEQQAALIRVQLRRCVIFSPLSDQELRELAEHVRLHACPEGAVILDQGDATRALFVVFAGDAGLTILSAAEGGELSHLTLVQGDFFGEHTFWKQNTMVVTAAADTACTLGEIPAAIFLRFGRKYPVMLQFVKRVCKRRYFAAMLAQASVFQECSAKERQTIAEYLSPVHVSQGVSILPEGDATGDLYIIQSGAVDVFTTLTEQGNNPILVGAQEPVALERLQEGEVFGEERFFTNEPGLITFGANTDVLLLKLSHACLTTFAAQFPGFRRRLYAIHQRRSQATMQAIQALLDGQC